MFDKMNKAKKLISEHKYDKAYVVLKSFHPSENEMNTYYMLLGVSSFELDNFDEALDAYKSLLSLYNEEESVEQLLGKSEVLYELSLTYFRMYETTKDTVFLTESIDSCKNAIKLCLGKISIEKTVGLMTYHKESIEPYFRCFIQLAVLYQSSNNEERAIALLNALKAYCVHNCEPQYLGVIYDELGNTYNLLGDSQIALGHYTKALAIKTKLGNERSAEYSYRNIARCLASNPGIMNDKMERIMGIYGGESI
ncbi:MAG: hypothetical protein FWG90_02805 [Oscillospiraceae bacterium]|nr:hypothetical protein [Oscillospiraceae bacterium]